MSQCDGRASCSSSTLSVGMASWLVSYSRLLSRIWEGSIGRKDRNSDAPAALNMLPKLLEVPISTYLMVLAKIRRPSMTPSASTSRSFSSRITSAASLATSVAESTEMPTSAACRARASLTPSPRNATSPPVRRCTRTMRALCSGLTRANTRGRRRSAPASASSSAASMSRAGQRRAGGRPRSAQTFAATAGLSPVTTLTVMPRPASRSSAARGVGLGRVQEHQQAAEPQVVLVGRGDRRLARARRGWPRRRPGCPAANSASSAARAAAGTSAHRSKIASGAPLVMIMRLPGSSSTRTETARRSWSNGSVASRR